MPHIARGGKEVGRGPGVLRRGRFTRWAPGGARPGKAADRCAKRHGIAVSNVTDSNGCSAHKMLRLPVTLRSERRSDPRTRRRLIRTLGVSLVAVAAIVASLTLARQ